MRDLGWGYRSHAEQTARLLTLYVDGARTVLVLDGGGGPAEVVAWDLSEDVVRALLEDYPDWCEDSDARQQLDERLRQAPTGGCEWCGGQGWREVTTLDGSLMTERCVCVTSTR